MTLSLPSPNMPSIAIDGSTERFPVRRIYCVGQNYASHAREMGSDPERQSPFFFAKPADAVVDSGSTIPFPPRTDDLQHEVELVVAIGAEGVQVSPEQAAAMIFAHAVGIDLTRRDLQAESKRTGRPWETAKAFDHSAPVGPLRRGPAPSAGKIRLSVNGVERQSGNLDQMIWSVDEVIAELSTYVRLAPGDLIFTGTPAGVSRLVRGDATHASIADLPALEITII